MRRRSSASPVDEALDLFLDTISNVFGGIIFIALLVVLLLQVTPAGPANPAARRADASAAALDAHVDALERITGAGDPGARAEIVSLLSSQGELRRSVDAEHARLESLRSREAEARVAAEQTAEQVRQTIRDTAAAEAELERLRSQSAGRVRVPQFRATGKSEIALLLAAGRVAPLLSDAGSLNTADVEMAGDARVRVRPGGGTAVTPENALILAQRLGPAAGSSSYVSLAVWPDAYAQAALLRDALVARGVEYNLVLLPPDGAVKTAATSGVQ